MTRSIHRALHLKRRGIGVLLLLGQCALASGAVSEKVGYKADPQFKVERKGKGSGDSLDPKKIEVQKDTLLLRFEGEWGPPTGDTGSNDPHITLWARVNIRFPIEYKLLSLEGPKGEEPVVIEKPEYKESTLVIPFEAFPESSGTLKLIGSDGTSTSYTLTIKAEAKDLMMLNSPDCDDLGIGVDPSNEAARQYRGPIVLLCQAKYAEDGKKTVQVAMEPFFKGSWGDTPSGASPIQGGRRLLFSEYDETKGATFGYRPKEKQNESDKDLEYRMGKGGISPGGSHWFGMATLGLIAGLQPDTGGMSFSVHGAWRPTYAFRGKPFLIRGLVGMTAFNSSVDDGGSIILINDLQVFFGYSGIRKLVIELGGGIQAWWGAANINPIGSLRVGWLQKRKILGILDRFEFGYSYYIFSAFPAHEFTAVAGFSF